MSDKRVITSDRVISRSKGVKFYDDDGSIKTLPAKQVQIVEPGSEQAAVEDSRRNFEQEDDATAKANGDDQIEAEVSNDEQAADSSAQAAAPASSTKRGKGKGKEQMATKKKAGKKKAAGKSTGNGLRMIGGREHDISGYERTKNASGHFSYDNGDDVATKLRGKTLDEVYAYAAKSLKEDEKELRKKYKHLNVGMQRMSLGNRLRKGTTAKAA